MKTTQVKKQKKLNKNKVGRKWFDGKVESDVVAKLKEKYSFAVVSGDNESERIRLQSMFPTSTDLLFNQTPMNKLDFVKALQ